MTPETRLLDFRQPIFQMGVDELTGRELDVAVARRVLGYEVEERVNTTTGEKDAFSRLPGQGKGWVRVAFYGVSLGASLNVEYELQHRGWRRRVTGTVKEPATLAEVILDHGDGRSVKAVGESRGEALCRAALKTVAE
ncbi:MAG TPA: hypothetical protein VIW26_00575 [Gemmatimonadales bacterium]